MDANDLFEHYNEKEPIHLSEDEYKRMIARLSDVIGALINLNNIHTTGLLGIIMGMEIDREKLLRIYLDVYKGAPTEDLVKGLFGGKVELDGDPEESPVS